MTRTVVTGTSTGIGFAIACRLAREGHEVHASVRSEESGAELLAAAAGLDLSLLVMDVSDDESVHRAFTALHDRRGPVDVLVNNAGVAGGGSVEETPLSEFERLMNTNTWGTLRCIQAVLPSMRERGAGHILNITSLAGRVLQGSQAAYGASKFATEAITEVLAIEARPFGIRVTAIEPGVIKTPIFTKGRRGLSPETPYVGSQRMKELFFSSLRGNPGSPDDVAEAVFGAIDGPDDRLRIPVGTDAELLTEHRKAMTDEEWVERQADPDDEAFRSWIGKLSDVEVVAVPD